MTLIEVMMALVILVLAVLSLFSAMATGRAIADTNQVRARVLAVMQAQMEIIQSDNKGKVLNHSDIANHTYDTGVAGLSIPPVSMVPDRDAVVQVRQLQQYDAEQTPPIVYTPPTGCTSSNLFVLRVDAMWLSRELSDTSNIESISPIYYYYADPTSP